MTLKTSPFAIPFPNMPDVAGVTLSAGHTGMKYKGRDDVMLAEFAEGTVVAGVLTKNSMCGIPIDWCREILPKHSARALIVNSGIANVATGAAGRDALEKTSKAVAELIGCEEHQVYISSTGVIGEPMGTDMLLNTLPRLKANLGASNWAPAAAAINTTDTFTKGISMTADIFGVEVVLNGFIKGSGMIQPNMATMLGYVFTDAKIPAYVLQAMLSEDTEISYNCMTVDSDTSTSDTILAFATGKKDHHAIASKDDPVFTDFRQKFRQMHLELAQLVAKDGEGVSKFITVKIDGAEHDAAAKTIALSIANSPLVKTAVAGGDPNWGRIAMAIGKTAETVNRDATEIWIGDTLIAKDGGLHESYIEAEAAEYMKGDYVTIRADVGVSNGSATVWTTDLTHGYIDINVDYRS
jgi:glutamate N-acetyltransferase/amino-acid N-acetyltransferase